MHVESFHGEAADPFPGFASQGYSRAPRSWSSKWTDLQPACGFGAIRTRSSCMPADTPSLPTPSHGLGDFLRRLSAEGHACVRLAPLSGAECEPGDALETMEALAREESLLPLPPLNRPAAQWAARSLYECTRAVVHRLTEVQSLASVLALTPWRNDDPATLWSVDLCLRHLPQIHQLAARVNHADPLLQELRTLGSRWPLSSVGMESPPDPAALEAVLGHPGLERLYLDRIHATRDRSRLRHPQVARRVREDIGSHPELSPELHAALSSTT